MTGVQRSRLRALAQQLEATSAHGPWDWQGGYPQRVTNGAAALIAECFDNPDLPPTLPEYLAAVSPDVVLRLLDDAEFSVASEDQR